MPTEDQMIAAVHAYIEGFAHNDPLEIIKLFAEDAIVEDPVGGAVRRGREEYSIFFEWTVGSGAKLTLDGPIRVNFDYAAFPFHVDLVWEGAPCRIDVVDVFRFDEAGKIKHMQAFFGDRNFVVEKGV